MGNQNQNKQDRRWFFSLFGGNSPRKQKADMVKMLTPDGQLVEVERSVYEAATKKQKATQQDIYNWMDNPSKK